MNQIVVASKAPAVPSAAIHQLTPYRVVDGWDGKRRTTIYFLARWSGIVIDRKPPHQSAMIVIPQDKRTFTLQWYPNGEEAQVMVELPIERLPEAVADLKAAGFK